MSPPASAGLEGRVGERTGRLTAVPQGKAAFAARAPDGSPWLEMLGRGVMHERRRHLPRSPSRRAQLRVPSAPAPGTGQGSPVVSSQGSSVTTGTLAATVVIRKNRDCSGNLIWCFPFPALHPGGTVWALPWPLLCSRSSSWFSESLLLFHHRLGP